MKGRRDLPSVGPACAEKKFLLFGKPCRPFIAKSLSPISSLQISIQLICLKLSAPAPLGADHILKRDKICHESRNLKFRMFFVTMLRKRRTDIGHIASCHTYCSFADRIVWCPFPNHFPLAWDTSCGIALQGQVTRAWPGISFGIAHIGAWAFNRLVKWASPVRSQSHVGYKHKPS